MAKSLRWSDLEFERILGEGKSGSVSLARLRVAFQSYPAGTQVAVKRYKHWVFDEPGQLDRYFREVEVGRQIIHPNLLHVLGTVVDDAGRPALVMQYYEGRTLAELLADSKPGQPLQTCLAILRDLASAIEELHRGGVIHRDVKPSNLVVTETGTVLADFGVVRSERFAEQTTTGAFLGTIQYAAPEYLFGEKYDQSIDVYSFGAVAYELFTTKVFYGKGQHWAKVIVAKAAPTEVTRNELEKLTSKYGLKATQFIRYLIDHSRCEHGARDLSLPHVIQAIDDGRWLHDTIVAPGPTFESNHRFNDGYTATKMAESIRAAVSDQNDLVRIREYIRKRFWFKFDPYEPCGKRLQSLLEKTGTARASHYGRPNSQVHIADSAKEAVALRLLD